MVSRKQLKKIHNKYVISGIGPGSCGVGRLMNSFKPRYQQLGYKIIHKRNPYSLKDFLKRREYFSLFCELFLRILYKYIFLLRILLIRNCEIILIHPQTVGFSASMRLIKKNFVTLYVMDNFFFCIQSYNYNLKTKIECLKCIGKIDPDKECKPYPTIENIKKAIEFLVFLQKYSNLIKFYSQNELQKKLLKMHFNCEDNVKIIGMHQIDVNLNKNLNVLIQNQVSKKYDIVYHGSIHPAKGIIYFIDLAKNLPYLTFLIPEETCKVKEIFNQNFPNNIFCIKTTWETGLKEYVKNAKLVINPSLWSAPIEGALIKSAMHNDNVATVLSKYGFESEFKGIKNHLRLSNNVMIASNQIIKFLKY